MKGFCQSIFASILDQLTTTTLPESRSSTFGIKQTEDSTVFTTTPFNGTNSVAERAEEGVDPKRIMLIVGMTILGAILIIMILFGISKGEP